MKQLSRCPRIWLTVALLLAASAGPACSRAGDCAEAALCDAGVASPQAAALLWMTPVEAPGRLLVTDWDESVGPAASLKLLLGPATVVVRPEALAAGMPEGGELGMVVLSLGTADAAAVFATVRRYAESGRTVVVDTAAYAAMTGAALVMAPTDHVRIVHESELAAGLKVGDRLPLHGRGRLAALAGVGDGMDTMVIAVAGPESAAALVQQQVGRGRLVVTDLQTPGEPYVWHPGTVYKYLFAANAVGNRARFGRLWPRKPTYAELVEQMKALAAEHAALACRAEGPAAGGYEMYSLTIGDAEAPGLLILGCVHGNEWENALGLVTFVRHVLERPAEVGFDPRHVRLTVVPVVCPSGYDSVSRVNANGVNLNRNGDVKWQEYTAADTNGDGAYGPGDQDWKGEAPLSEPETRTLMGMVARGRFRAVLDLHSNPSGMGFNKLMSSRSSLPGAAEAAETLARRFTERVAGRYVLRQQHEKTIQRIVNEGLWNGSSGPTLNASTFLAAGRHSVLVELPGGFWMQNPVTSAYGTFLCTDLVSELCVAFVETYGKLPAAAESRAAASPIPEGEQR